MADVDWLLGAERTAEGWRYTVDFQRWRAARDEAVRLADEAARIRRGVRAEVIAIRAHYQAAKYERWSADQCMTPASRAEDARRAARLRRWVARLTRAAETLQNVNATA